jgi:hypothetical protein
VRDYGRIARFLINLIKAGVVFCFDGAYIEAFEELKSRLIFSELLKYYDFKLSCRIKTDILDRIIAGIFSQFYLDGEWHPVAYFSKIILTAEYNYEIYDKEILVIIRLLQIWRPELQGTPIRIKIYINYRILEYFITTKKLIPK